jgi:molybdenum cofactor cytidylyltransferase
VREIFLTSIVLAAGLSRRMGEENKLLLPFGGTTILEMTLSNILPSQLGETLVVVGHEAADIVKVLAKNFAFQISDVKFKEKKPIPRTLKALLSDEVSTLQWGLPPLSITAQNQLFFKILLNEDYEKGMTTSIQKGVEAASEESLGYMICLSDMPFITPAEYKFLADAFFDILEQDRQAIVQPTFEGNRGNPTIFSNFYKKDILDLTYTEGCKPIVQNHKKHLYLVEMPTDSVVKDIDFRQEYDRLRQL